MGQWNWINKEQKLMKKATKLRNRNRFYQPVAFLSLTVALLAMFFGYLAAEDFVYKALPFVLFLLVLPRSDGAPRYNDLLDVLERHVHHQPTAQEIVVGELKKHDWPAMSDS